MKNVIILLLLATYLSKTHAEPQVPMLPNAQICEVGKPKKGRFTGIEACQEGDLLVYEDYLKRGQTVLFIRLCVWGTLRQTNMQGGMGYTNYCIYRGSEMPIRE